MRSSPALTVYITRCMAQPDKTVRNMALISMLSILVLICQSVASASLVTLSQGGYSNVVVGFSSQVPQPANCTDLLNNLEVRNRKTRSTTAVLLLFPPAATVAVSVCCYLFGQRQPVAAAVVSTPMPAG